MNNMLTDGFQFSPLGFAFLEMRENKRTHDSEYHFIGVNPAFERMTGVEAEKLSGKRVSQAFPLADNQKSDWGSLFDRIANKMGIAEFAYSMDTYGKSYLVNAWKTDEFHCAVTFTEVTADNPQIPKDVYQHAFWDNNLFGVIIADKNGNYVDANDEASRMTGYSCTELKSMSILHLIEPDRIEEARTHFEQIANSGRAYGEVAYYTKSGEKRWWNVVATKLSGGYFIGLHEDITGRKKMEQELSRNVEFNKKLLASIPDVVIQTNLEGIITFVNEPLFIDYPFITPEQLLGRSIFSFVAPQDLGRMEENVRLMFEKPLGIKEYALRFGDDLELNCEANGDVFCDKHGNPTGMVFVIRDITERKKAEQALKKNEERFRLMIKNISAIIVTLDKNGIQQFISPAAEKITGYTPEELTGKPISEVIHPDDLPMVMKVWEEGTRNPNTEISVQYRHIHKTKGWVYLETVGQSFLNEPAVNAVIAIVHDITERRQTEEALQLRSIVLDQIKDHVTITDLKGVITYANSAVCETMKRPSYEIIGQSTRVYGEDPGRGATQQEIVTQTLQAGDWRGEVVNYSADGREHIMDCRTRIVYDELGTPIALCGISTNITERKQAEASLKENELKFRTLFENSGDAIFIMKGDTFIECNAATLEIYGCQSPDQILGKTPFDFSPAHQPNGLDSREYALEIIDAAVGGTTQFFEWTHIKLDGTPFTAEVKLNKLKLNGLILIQAIVRDITERKQAEEELLQTQNNLANKEAQYRLLAENSRDLIYVYSLVPEPHYEYISPSCLQLTGFRPEEGYTDPYAYHKYINTPEGIERFSQFLLDPSLPTVIEEEWQRKDGTRVWVEQVISRNFDENGHLISFQSTVRDITIRKRAEEALHKLSQAVEQSPASVIISNMDGVIEYVNPKFTEVTGYTPEEAIGQKPKFIAASEQPDEIYPELWETISSGKEWKGEFQNKKKNGELYWEAVSISPIYHKSGTITHFLEVKEDITQRKSTELEMERNRAELRAIYDNAPVMMAVIDENRNLLFANPAFTAFTGVPESELKNGRVCGVFGCINAAEDLKGCGFGEKCKSCNLLRSIEDSFLNGSTHKDIEYNTTLVRNNTEKVISLLGSVAPIHFAGKSLLLLNFVDISERKQAEEALRESSALLERSQQIANIGSWKFDVSVNRLEWSDEVFRIFSCEPQEFEATYETFLSFVHPDDRGMVNEAYTSSLQEKRDSYEVEHRIIRKATGEVRFVHERCIHEFDAAGAIIRSIGMVQDITERKQAEEELEASQKTTAKLNTLLNAILESPQDLVVFALDGDYCYTAFTKAHKLVMKNLWGADIKVGDNMLDYINLEEDRNKAQNSFKRCLNGEFFILEEEYGDSSLQRTFYETRYSPLFNDRNEIIGLTVFNIDITGRKKADEVLKTERMRLAGIIEGTHVGTWEWNVQTGETVFNERWANIIGYTLEEISPVSIATWKKFAQPDDLKKSEELLNKHFNGKLDYYEFESRLQHKNGEWVWVLDRGKAVRWSADGKPLMMLGTHTDITERKRAEEEIKASEKKFRELSTLMRLMTDNMPDMLWAKNLNKEFIFTNKAICNNLLNALDTEEPLGKTDMFFASRERNAQPGNPQWHTFGEICRDSDSITLEELKPMQFDEFGNVKGKFLFLDVYKAPLYDEQGQLIGVVGSARDITERNALEKNLNYQTRLRELLMEISSGFINIPLESVEGSVNEALRKMGMFVNADRAYTFDYDWENKVCQNTYEWCNEGIGPEIQNLQNIPLSVMIEAVEEHKKGNTMCIPDVNAMPDGTAKELMESQGVQSFIMVPMMNQDECTGFVGFDSVNGLRDYSPAEIQLLEVFAQLLANVKIRKVMVEQLVIAKEKAEESDRLKSAFLANMSHEIRTPMNGILGFAELLKEPGLDGEEQQNYIAIIEKSGHRMLNIINDIVDISKIEAGLMDIHLAESDIAEQMEYIHSFFKPEAEAKKLKLSVKNSLTRRETTLVTDREKLYAILTNLVKNAIKYTEKGEIELGCNRKGNFLEFYIKDTGIGIPEVRQQAVFERFVQADIEDKMARQGAGLGLAISKAYIEMLGGRIWLESQEGVGSIFRFTLPFEGSPDIKTENRPDLSSHPSEAQISQFNILLVEDDSISELLLEIEMKKYGNKISKVHTGTDAVEYIRNHPDTEVVLMDIQLPGINGYDATRQIRQFNQKVVIIAQTAYGLAGDRQKAIEAGCNDYIAKPIKMTELRSILQQHFRI